jgi:uncharacterized small protein (DUF1192 family)
MDEEEVRIRPVTGIGRDLRTLSIDELEAYAGQLRAEMARVDAETARRRNVRSAADALFRRLQSDEDGDGGRG